LAKELLTSNDFIQKAKSSSKLPCAIGKDTDNKPFNIDFSESGTPHLLISGTSGSGKSVLINGMVCSDLISKKPDELKLIFIDAKKAGAEFGTYDNISHLAMPVVKDMKNVLPTLRKISGETLRRYKMFANIKVGGVAIKDIKSFNALVTKDPSTMSDEETTAYESIPENDRKKMPALKVYIDEAAALLKDKDFGKAARHEVDETLKIARAAGVHLILASQSPDKSSIDGDLQQNLGSKIMLRLTDQADADGANVPEATDLLDNGDGIFMDANGKKRLQSAYMADSDIAKIVKQAEGKQEFIQFEGKKQPQIAPADTSAFEQYRQGLADARKHLEEQRLKMQRVLEESEEKDRDLRKKRDEARRLHEQEKARGESLSDIDQAREKRIKDDEALAKKAPSYGEEEPQDIEKLISGEPTQFNKPTNEEPESLESEEEPGLPKDKVQKEIDEMTKTEPAQVEEKKSNLKSMLDRIKKLIHKQEK
jgi:hypothetical protein